MTENVFLRVGTVILCQGARGIPIGGLLSAQIAEIWACSKAYIGLFGDSVKSEGASISVGFVFCVCMSCGCQEVRGESYQVL